MYEIEIKDEFQAAHFLKLYDGSFEPRHGHNWEVRVVVRSEKLDSMQVVTDFEALKPVLKRTLGELHETCVNNHAYFKDGKVNPSAENIAKLIGEKLQKNYKWEQAMLHSVTACETYDACATVYFGTKK